MDYLFPHIIFNTQLLKPYNIYGCFTAIGTENDHWKGLFRTLRDGNFIINLVDGKLFYKKDEVTLLEVNDFIEEELLFSKAREKELEDLEDLGYSYNRDNLNHSWCLYLEKERLTKKMKLPEPYESIKLRGSQWNFVNVCNWVKDAGDLVKRAPTIKYFRDEENIYGFDTEQERLMFLILHYCIPENYHKYFKSSKQAYRVAKEFFDIGRKNKYGYTCLSEDGHVCNSLDEAKIDDFLYRQNLTHEKEPYYPKSNWRADFKINEVYIEYFGLTGNKIYDIKTKAKIEYANKNKLKLISIYPQDMSTGNYKAKIIKGIDQ